MRTKQSSIKSLLGGVEQAKAEHKYDIVRDLKLLHGEYVKTSKRDYLALLRAMIEKYENGLSGDIDAVLRKRCLAGDIEAIRLFDERKKSNADGTQEVQIVDDIPAQ